MIHRPAPRASIFRSVILVAACAWLVACGRPSPGSSDADAPVPKIGVVYVVHGGFAERSPESLWSATVQIFAYDPHSTVYRRVIWNPAMWPRILNFGNAPKERGKYAFEYRRIGGVDPSNGHYANRLEQLRAELAGREGELGVEFVVDIASWITSDPAHGAPSNDAPVQAQYRGTWSVWQPPNSRPEVAAFLADHVVADLERRR